MPSVWNGGGLMSENLIFLSLRLLGRRGRRGNCSQPFTDAAGPCTKTRARLRREGAGLLRSNSILNRSGINPPRSRFILMRSEADLMRSHSDLISSGARLIRSEIILMRSEAE